MSGGMGSDTNPRCFLAEFRQVAVGGSDGMRPFRWLTSWNGQVGFGVGSFRFGIPGLLSYQRRVAAGLTKPRRWIALGRSLRMRWRLVGLQRVLYRVLSRNWHGVVTAAADWLDGATMVYTWERFDTELRIAERTFTRALGSDEGRRALGWLGCRERGIRSPIAPVMIRGARRPGWPIQTCEQIVAPRDWMHFVVCDVINGRKHPAEAGRGLNLQLRNGIWKTFS